VGDFNIIPADVDTHNQGHPYHDTNTSALEEERGWLDRFVEAGFVDLFAHHYTQAVQQLPCVLLNSRRALTLGSLTKIAADGIQRQYHQGHSVSHI
jgi:hypothetical protein